MNKTTQKLNTVNKKLNQVIQNEKAIKSKLRNKNRNKNKKQGYNSKLVSMRKQFTTETKGYFPHKTLSNPNNMRGLSVYRTEKLLNDYGRFVRLQYIMGSLHPSLAFENKWDVRYPSLLPVPTACLRVKQTHNLTTGTSGQMYINYVPGTLISSNAAQGEASGITVNTTCNGSGTAGSNSFVAQPFQPVPQMWDRYRIVGAEIKVTYTGNVFDRKGTIYGGVHYEPASIAMKGVGGTGTITGLTNSFVDRFSSNLGLIQNQLWPEVKTLSEDEIHMSYVWTPDSPANLLYAGYIPISSGDFTVLNCTQSYAKINSGFAQVMTNNSSNNTTGPDRNINFYLQGLPATNQCVRVDIFELFEYIPDVSALNIVSVSTTRMEAEDVHQFSAINPVHHDEIKVKNMSDVLSKPEVYTKPSLGKKMGNFITKIGGGLVDRAVESLLLAL